MSLRTWPISKKTDLELSPHPLEFASQTRTPSKLLMSMGLMVQCAHGFVAREGVSTLMRRLANRGLTSKVNTSLTMGVFLRVDP